MTTLQEKLADFATWVDKGIHTYQQPFCDMCAEELKQLVTTHFTRSGSNHTYRVSNLGKPEVLQALYKLGYVEPSAGINNALMRTFYIGLWFESYVSMMLREYGFTLSHIQHEVDFHGCLGHTDVVINYGDESAVADFKTMKSWYFKKFTKSPTDDKGYLTQISVYASCLRMKPYIICFDKGEEASPAISVVPISREAYAESVHRAKNIVQTLALITKPEDVYEYFKPPNPVAEYYKRETTGNWLVPPEMKYTISRYMFYDIVYELNGYKKPTEYVTGIVDSDEFVKRFMEGQGNVEQNDKQLGRLVG